MEEARYEGALIVGAGTGLSASLAARNIEKLAPLCEETGAKAYACNAIDPAEVVRLFAAVEAAPTAEKSSVRREPLRRRDRIRAC